LQSAKAEVQWLISMGFSPDAALIQRAGWDPTLAGFGNSTSSGNSSSGGNGYNPKPKDDGGVDDGGYNPKPKDDGGVDDEQKGDYRPVWTVLPPTLSELSTIMTKTEWQRRKNAYDLYGTGGIEVAEFDTYDDYYQTMLDYIVEDRKKN
jgi:hypothetical protein